MGKSIFNRKQIKSAQAQYDWATVTSGIPEGSVLGQLLFIIVMNDLPDCVILAIIIVAVDRKIYREFKDQSDKKKTTSLQKKTTSLKKWSRD